MKKKCKKVVVTVNVHGIDGAISGTATLPDCTVIYSDQKDVVTLVTHSITFRIEFKDNASAVAFAKLYPEDPFVVQGNIATVEYKDEDIQMSYTVKLSEIIEMVE